MAVLFLTEEEVQKVLTMEMAIEGVEAALRKMALDEAVVIPRSRCQTDQTILHTLPAAAKSLGVIGFKAYTTTKSAYRFHVTIYDGRTGEMTALMQGDLLGQMRTGAASAVATKYLAQRNAATVGIFGTGKQARTQLQGVCKVRKISKAFVYSRDEVRRNTFAAEMAPLCGIEVIPVADPKAAAIGMDIICTATTAREPILFGEWVSPGTHLNIAGSNFLAKAEIDTEVVRKSGLVVIDSLEQGKQEAGDLMPAIDAKIIAWSDVYELGRVMTRGPVRESEEQITLFKSLGIGLEDIVVAQKVLLKAREVGIGKLLDL